MPHFFPMTTLEATFDNLPQPILDKLQLMIRRVRRLLFVRGIFATLAVALICVLAIMALDATLTIFSNTVRWTLSLAGLAITCVTAWWFLVRPLSRKITLTHIARILEIRHPELQERISTAVELMSSDDPNSIKGSEELIEAVVDSAVIDVEAVDPKTEFKPARAKKFITTTGICLGLIVILLAIWPKQSWTLLTRALAPFLDIGNAYADTLVVDPGDVRIAQGDSVTITMTIDHKRLRRAEVRRRLADGSESVERMILMGETDEGHKRFSLTFPKVDASFEYRVRAGSAVTEFYDVEAVPLPIVEELKIRYDYPEYTHKKPVQAVSKTGEIRALANTQVTVTATVNKPVWSSKLLFNEHQEIGEPISEGNVTTWTFPLKPRMNGTWQLDLSDSDGFKNAATSYPIQALPDKAPTVQITSPVAREIRVKPTELLPIKYEAIEDFGFQEIALLVTANGEVSPTEIIQPSPETDNRPGIWRGMAQLNISELDLKPHHNKLTVQVRARDNRPENLNGPGEGISETIIIHLDKNAQSLAKQAIAEDKKNLEQALREAQTELAKAKAEIKSAERELQRDEDFSDRARKEVEDFNKNKKAAEEKLKTAAEQLQEGVFKKQAEALEDIVKDEIAKAQETADMIPVTDEKKERIAQAKEVEKQIDQAIADLKEVEKSVRDSESERNMIAGLNDLANDQREIARDATKRSEQQLAQQKPKTPQLDKQQQKEMREFQAKQKQVQKELGEMLKDNAAALEEILKQQKQESSELSEKATQLAKEQQDLKEINQDATNKAANREELKKQLIAQLQKAQKEIASDTQKQEAKPEQGKNEAPQPKEEQTQAQAENKKEANSSKDETTPLEKAKRQTEAASSKLNAETLAQAMKEAQDASKSLTQAAENARDESANPVSPEQSDPAKPGTGSSYGRRAGTFRKRKRQSPFRFGGATGRRRRADRGYRIRQSSGSTCFDGGTTCRRFKISSGRGRRNRDHLGKSQASQSQGQSRSGRKSIATSRNKSQRSRQTV